MNLKNEIKLLSWRRFLNLLQGLSLNSYFHLLIKKQSSSERVIEDVIEGERAVDNLLGGKKKGV